MWENSELSFQKKISTILQRHSMRTLPRAVRRTDEIRIHQLAIKHVH
jgi:hypothetical protein